MTNAEKIRSMTDEELCEFLRGTLGNCYNCGFYRKASDISECGEECPMCEDVHNWLQKEAGEL